MKNKLKHVLLATFGISLIAPNAFAAKPYGIEYSGGEILGENNTVTINAPLVDGLTPLIKIDGDTTYQFSDSPRWKDTYVLTSTRGCQKGKYLTFWNNNLINPSEDISYKISRGNYETEIKINQITVDGDLSGITESSAYTIHVLFYNGLLAAGGTDYYFDQECQNRVPNIKYFHIRNDEAIYLETNIKLYEKGSSEVFTSDQLYFGITDIDAAQAYKIKNPDNLLMPDNMFAKSAASLQPQDPNIQLRNMYVENGNYIYAQYSNAESFDTLGSNVYVKIKESAQRDGLNMIYGYRVGGSASGVEYYAKQYTITYESDDNGTITGITSEDIISGYDPSGSSSTPNENFELVYWVSDKDVTLKSGVIIKAGEKLTITQIKEVVVNQDLKFTAIHKDEIKVPNTGAFTKDTNATAIILPIFGIILGALIIRLLPKITKKKIGFE